jgi:hypothetical protein
MGLQLLLNLVGGPWAQFSCPDGASVSTMDGWVQAAAFLCRLKATVSSGGFCEWRRASCACRVAVVE